jgi:uncharacterized radical SAM superfamily Fe-S cluster-containing enzyme
VKSGPGYRRQTRSLCPQCDDLVPALIFEEGDGLAMRVDCPRHGPQETPFLADKRFYLDTARWIDRRNERDLPDGWRGTDHHLQKARDVYIDLTEQCNFNCPACYTNANARVTPDLTTAEIFAGVDRIPGRIVVSLLGGEPTLRPDLADIVRYIAGRGHVLKLITNGLLLTEEKVRELADAGLKWVVLQFDGFSDDIYRTTRGRPLLRNKLEVIDRLARHGIHIVLASMIVRGVNDHEVGRILHYALCHPAIVQIGFLPHSNVGRNRIGPPLETSAFIDLMEEQTGGRVRRADFVRGMVEGQVYSELTGNLAYKSRTCCQGLFLFHDGYGEDERDRALSDVPAAALHEGKTLLPIDRALASTELVRRPAQLADALRTVANWNRRPVDPHLLGIVVENFRNKEALDFDDAKNCTKVYLTRDGFIPNCLYNILYRPRIQNADG